MLCQHEETIGSRLQRLLIICPILMCPAARICCVNTQLLFLRGAHQLGIPDFIKPPVLVFKFCSQLVNLRFDQSQHCIGFLNDGVIAFLGPPGTKMLEASMLANVSSRERMPAMAVLISLCWW
jgi:hypothetical protein